MARSRSYSTRPRTACTRRRGFWRGVLRGGDLASAHDPEKWEPVFGQDHAQTIGSQFRPEPLHKTRMSHPDLAIPTRAPAEVSADDTVLPFEVAPLDLRGRVVRLGPAVDAILSGHDYPQPVAKLLGEAIVLGVVFGPALKFEGRFILQTKADGPVRMMVVDFMTPDKVRACARFDKDRVAEAIAASAGDAGSLLGRGHL